MLDIEKELDGIMEKYGMGYEVCYKESLKSVICEIIQKAVQQYGKKIIVRGLKKSNLGKYPILSLLEEQAEVVGVVDLHPFDNIVRFEGKHGLKEVPFVENGVKIEKKSCDIYIINTLYQGKNIYYEVKDELQAKGIGVIDLYKMIRTNYSLAPSKLYDEYDKERDFSYNLIWHEVNVFRKYKNQESLEKLLSVCLYLRDFVSFFRYVEEGKDIVNRTKKIQELVKEIQNFLGKVKRQIEIRERSLKQKDIIVHWIDQLSYGELFMLPKLSKRIQNALFFENSYTVTPYTRPTARMMFWKEFRGITDEHSKKVNGEYEEKSLEDSTLYQKIRHSDYNFQVCGYVKKILEKEAAGLEMCEFSVASTVHYFQMINKIINASKPIFGIVHILNETHEPYVSPESGLENKSFEFQNAYAESKEKIEASAAYADELIDFYTELIGNNSVGIYMSDHGKWEDIDRRRYQDTAMHTILGITNIGLRGRVERTFSYQCFEELVEWVLKLAAPEEMFFNDLPIYSEGFKAAIRERTQEVEEIYSGYKGVNTSQDKYVRLDNGQEFYFLKSENELENHVFDLTYEERVNELRQRCNELEGNLYKNIK